MVMTTIVRDVTRLFGFPSVSGPVCQCADPLTSCGLYRTFAQTLLILFLDHVVHSDPTSHLLENKRPKFSLKSSKLQCCVCDKSFSLCFVTTAYDPNDSIPVTFFPLIAHSLCRGWTSRWNRIEQSVSVPFAVLSDAVCEQMEKVGGRID